MGEIDVQGGGGSEGAAGAELGERGGGVGGAGGGGIDFGGFGGTDGPIVEADPAGGDICLALGAFPEAIDVSPLLPNLELGTQHYDSPEAGDSSSAALPTSGHEETPEHGAGWGGGGHADLGGFGGTAGQVGNAGEVDVFSAFLDVSPMTDDAPCTAPPISGMALEGRGGAAAETGVCVEDGPTPPAGDDAFAFGGVGEQSTAAETGVALEDGATLSPTAGDDGFGFGGFGEQSAGSAAETGADADRMEDGAGGGDADFGGFGGTEVDGEAAEGESG
ncbi:hypothetical protein T484DRAFT_1922644, partial [Baffinella frigidus]